MSVLNLGFFRELPHGDPKGPSLRECIYKGDPLIQGRLASYLDSSPVLAITGSSTLDVLSEVEKVSGRLAVSTDGVWLWPADLGYYVRSYNIALPSAFIDRATSLNWIPPSLSSDDLLTMERELFSGESSEY